MSLKEKDENNTEAISISCIYDTYEHMEDNLLKETYANMILAENDKALGIFIYYDNKNQIDKISLRILKSSDIIMKSSEIMKIVEYLRVKRGMQLNNKKVGRNDLCPCGSREKI